MIMYGREYCTARGCDGRVCKLCRTLYPKRNIPFINKKPDKILCIKLKMDTQYIESIDTPREFAEALIASTLNNRRYDDVQNSKTKDIDIGEINIFNFKMSYEEKLQLYLIGVNSQ